MERKILKTIAAASLVYVCLPKTRNLFTKKDCLQVFDSLLFGDCFLSHAEDDIIFLKNSLTCCFHGQFVPC